MFVPADHVKMLLGATLFYLCFFSKGYLASDIFEDRDRLAKYFRDSLDNVRSEMSIGFPEFKIPPLEPLVLSDIKIDSTHSMVKLKLNLHEIKIAGISGFQTQDLDVNLDDLAVGVKLLFPHLTASGWYEVDGKVVHIFPVFGQGNYTIVARDVFVGASGRLVLTAETMEVTDFKPHLEWSKLDLDLKNFLGGGTFGQAVQRLLPVIGKLVFDRFKPDIINSLGTFLTKELNQQMTRPEVKSLVQKILEELTSIED